MNIADTRYHKGFLITALMILSVLFLVAKDGLSTYKVQVQNKAYQLSLDKQERAVMQFYEDLPLDYFSEYHSIKIIGQKGKDFVMHSDTTRGNQDNLLQIWRDTAYFRDKDGLLVARTIPCAPTYVRVDTLNPDCRIKGNWFQHQWWRQMMSIKDKRSIESWVYTQYKIPPEAVTMDVCSNLDVLVYKGYLGEVHKKGTTCTNQNFVLKDAVYSPASAESYDVDIEQLRERGIVEWHMKYKEQ